VKRAYTRALELCKEGGFDEHTLPAVFGLWSWNFLRAALGEAQILAEHLVNAAEFPGSFCRHCGCRSIVGRKHPVAFAIL
jgi:hypothetical protein